MLDEFELGPGFPEWTEVGQETGLDPLGMQRPIELVYQSLLPGISTITLRVRYYSFFAWLLEVYANQPNVTNEYEAFRRFQRKAEALFALICAHGAGELGVAGIDWATRQLNSIDKNDPNATIDFRIGADPDSEENLRYLRNKGGAFRGIYASQMREMGLVKLDDPDLPIPFCKEVALPLAHSFAAAVGERADLFLSAVEAGKVSVAELERLSVFKPSRIEPESDEQAELTAVLMARHSAVTDGDSTRGKSLKMLLELAKEQNGLPKSEETKWQWFGASSAFEVTTSDSDLLAVWALYQTSDLLRLAYEVLLFVSLRQLANAPPNSTALQNVVTDVSELTELSDEVSLQEWIDTNIQKDGLEDMAQHLSQDMLDALASAEDDLAVRYAWKLIIALIKKSQILEPSVLGWLGAAGHFQSLKSEGRHIGSLLRLPVQTAFQELLRDRILRRHLWVASRKFRNQKAYTFLFEPDEGLLRFRDYFRVSASSPRIEQAVQFLRDIKLLDESGITDLGLQELETA